MAEEANQVELQTPFFRAVTLRLAIAAAWVFMTLFGPLKVRGRYRVPKKGGLLILANHQSDLDPPAVQVACPRPVYFMAKSELFEMKVLGRIIRAFRAFPVKRGEPDRTAIKKAAAYLHAGQVVCVFPEGELSDDGELLPLKPGIALIVRMADCPVICLGLVNTRKMMPCGSLIPRPAFGGVSANWGEIRQFDRKAQVEDILTWAESQLRELTGQTRD